VDGDHDVMVLFLPHFTGRKLARLSEAPSPKPRFPSLPTVEQLEHSAARHDVVLVIMCKAPQWFSNELEAKLQLPTSTGTLSGRQGSDSDNAGSDIRCADRLQGELD
jgi:hypothetical protein